MNENPQFEYTLNVFTYKEYKIFSGIDVIIDIDKRYHIT